MSGAGARQKDLDTFCRHRSFLLDTHTQHTVECQSEQGYAEEESLERGTFEERAEQFEEAITREDYLSGAGLKDTFEIAPIYERYADLFSDETVRGLLDQRQTKEGQYLASFATFRYLENSVKGLTQEGMNRVMKMTVSWDSQEIPFRSAPVALANEPDPDRRHELQRRIMDMTAELNPLLSKRQQELGRAMSSLGFTGYVAMCDQLRDLDLANLTGWMKLLLARTADSYAQRLGYYLRRLGLSPNEAYTGDLTYLFRAPEYDSLFPKEALVSTLRKTLIELGLDLAAQHNLELDIESRPLKSPRAFCAPIRVPEEVKLVISPRGGQDDYRAILHESGHAEHAIFTAPDLPFAFKRLGDNSVTEGYAFLFDNLVQNRRWLSTVLGVSNGEGYVQFALFYKCYMLRRYATKLLYEQELHAGQGDMAQRYAALFEKSLLVRHWPQNYLADVDDFFYSAQYIRAWIFEVQIRRYLQGKWGDDWFRNPAAGQFLVGLYHRGQKDNADELARELGYRGLDPEPLIEELIG